MKDNPYRYRGALDPIKDSLVCIPRTSSIQKVVKGLQKGDYWMVLGPRQIGKTTFLRQLEQTLDGDLIVSIDFTVSPGDVKMFYPWLIDYIKKRIPHHELVGKEIGTTEPFQNFISFLEQFQPLEDKNIVFLFDEIEGIPFVEEFLNLWRIIHEGRYQQKELNRYQMVVAGSSMLFSLAGRWTSPFFNIAEKLYLEDFNPAESNQFVDIPFKKLKIYISQEAKEKLIKNIAGHPQMLQQACSILVEFAIGNKKAITESDVEKVLGDLLEMSDSIETLKRDLVENVQLETLIFDILKGGRLKYEPSREFSFFGAGCIVSDHDSFCIIRNEVFKKYLRDNFGLLGLIDEVTKNVFFDKKEIPLPYAIKQIQIEKFYGIKKLVISDIPVDTQWIFLTGNNGYGKTLLLQALTIGLYGNIDVKETLAYDLDEYKVSVELLLKGKNQFFDFVSYLGSQDEFSRFPYFAVYGPSRVEIQSPETQNVIAGKSSQIYSLFHLDGALLNIEQELIITSHKKEKKEKDIKAENKFNAIIDVLRQVLFNIKDIQVIEVNGKDRVMYREREEKEDGETFEPVTFDKLALGHRCIVAMVGDILLRLSESQPEIDNPKEFGGIVIIDELDLHLHPKWLSKLPSLLSSVFPKVQFIASTHSVIPFLGAPEKSVILKVLRNKVDGIQVERLDYEIDIKNLLPNSILTSPIFEIDKITHQSKQQDLSRVRTEVDYKIIEKRDRIRLELKEFEESDKDYPVDFFKRDLEKK